MEKRKQTWGSILGSPRSCPAPTPQHSCAALSSRVGAGEVITHSLLRYKNNVIASLITHFINLKLSPNDTHPLFLLPSKVK